MRSHVMGPALVCAVLASTVPAGAQRLQVFVSHVEAPAPRKPSEVDRQAASAAIAAADTARKDLEKNLKAQYGNKRDKWPAEAQERLADAEEVRDRENASWGYWSQAEPIKPVWGRDIDRALTSSGLTGRKEHVTTVATSDEAQLIVSLIGIRDPAGASNVADDRCLKFLVANGPKLSDALFARMPRAYRPRRALAKRLEGPSASSPAWQFEACGLQNYFKEDEAVANVVNDFAGALLATTGSAGQ